MDDFKPRRQGLHRPTAKLDTMRRDFSTSDPSKNIPESYVQSSMEEPSAVVVSDSGVQPHSEASDQLVIPTNDDQPSEPAFKTPEEVAESEAAQSDTGAGGASGGPQVYQSSDGSMGAPPKKPRWKPHKPNWSRKQWIIAGIVAAAAVFAITFGIALALSHHKAAPVPPPKPVPKPAPAPQPKPILSPLTGMPVTQQQHDLSVIGVMIENSPDARPQSGLDQAGVVFEAIAEAGITRFLALYQEGNPAVIGPVRSSRPYYLDWAMAFDASYAHVGGSPDALQRIKDIGVKDMDQFFNAGAYHRISSRYAPHNMYTSMDSLRKLANSKGYTTSTFTPLPRKEKETPSASPNAKSIDFAISGPTYNVHYDYDPATNSYKRSEGGTPHIDNETKQQLSPKVVIALAMPYSLMPDGYHSDYQTQGSGNMLVFQDGTVTPGTWTKAAPKDQFVFTGADNKPLLLNPGQTWITALGNISEASYHP